MIDIIELKSEIAKGNICFEYGENAIGREVLFAKNNMGECVALEYTDQIGKSKTQKKE